jgi:NTE family protein
VSIGAINAAIIAGNPPNSRVDRLREFWSRVTADRLWSNMGNASFGFARGDDTRRWLNQMSSGVAVASGARGFFSPHPVAPWFQPSGTIEATSFYDTHDLKRTLEKFIDFDRLNSGEVHFSAGAVNVRTGNFVYFDNATRTIRPEHVMASGALPPGFPAIEIEGEYYWAADSSRIDRWNGWSMRNLAATRWPFRLICGARGAIFRATCSKS